MRARIPGISPSPPNSTLSRIYCLSSFTQLRLSIDFELDERVVDKPAGFRLGRLGLVRPFDRHRAAIVVILHGRWQAGALARFDLARLSGPFVPRQRADHHVDATAN